MDSPLLKVDTGDPGISERISDKDHLPLPKHLEELFLTMHYRKMQRELNGPQKKKSRRNFVALAVLLVIEYGMAGPSNQELYTGIQINLPIESCIAIGVWIFVAIVISSILAGSKFIILLHWMFIYWPLLSIVAATLIIGDNHWIWIWLIILEAGTLVVFLVVYYVYPRLVTSRRFLGNKGATRFWGIKLMDDGITMEYYGMWGRLGRRYQCRYKGETNKEGLPHGQGVWADDTYHGEILTGRWEEGTPVAPFSSRQYGGKGNTFSAVRIAYFMATDDTFEANKLVPTNDEPPRVGVASVECSIAGHFMNHLPDASLVGGAQVEGDSNTIGTCCNQMDYSSPASSEDLIASLQISTDSRGVQIGGHTYVPTGLPFTKRVNQITVDVIRSESEALGEALDVNDEENVAKGDASMTDHSMEYMESTAGSHFRLDVKNWTKIKTKDALIFLPGFNSWLQHSLETFGQLMAMTPKMNQHVYPVLFAWPGAQVLTYRQASFISASENNRKYFLQMLLSLKAEGITNIHIVSHSLGVQTLMNCFEDNSDGSASQVAQCFGSAPRYGDASLSVLNLGKLVCRSITMLNPDFPVHAFRERGFQSIRRVCSLITVVGDKSDQALFWSSLINGLVNGFGQLQPSSLDFEDRCKQKGIHLQEPLGKNIDLLYVEEDTDQHGDIAEFQRSAQNLVTSPSAGREGAKLWLDCDVIDTTGLDTNVNDLRHSAFNVNSILLRDIEELVVSGKRASDRTTLLHKRGNVFEFCHAPSFVKY